MKLADRALLFTVGLAAISRPPESHSSYQKIGANLSRLDQLDKELAELLLFILGVVPVVLTFVFSGLLKFEKA